MQAKKTTHTLETLRNIRSPKAPFSLPITQPLIDEGNARLLSIGIWTNPSFTPQHISITQWVQNWQNIFIKQLIEELKEFHCQNDFLTHFNERWDINNTRAALFKTQLQGLSCVMKAISSKYRYAFLSYFYSEGDKGNSFVTSNFHPDFLNLFDEIQGKTVINNLKNAILLLCEKEQRRIKKRIFHPHNNANDSLKELAGMLTVSKKNIQTIETTTRRPPLINIPKQPPIIIIIDDEPAPCLQLPVETVNCFHPPAFQQSATPLNRVAIIPPPTTVPKRAFPFDEAQTNAQRLLKCQKTIAPSNNQPTPWGFFKPHNQPVEKNLFSSEIDMEDEFDMFGSNPFGDF